MPFFLPSMSKGISISEILRNLNMTLNMYQKVVQSWIFKSDLTSWW